MELTITKTVEVPILSRKRVISRITFDKETPTRLDVNAKLAAGISAPEHLIVTRHIYTQFGKRAAKVISHIYSNEEDLLKNEHHNIIKKNKPKQDAKAEETKAEA